MGFLGSVLGVVGGLAGEMVKDATGIDLSETVSSIKEGRLDDAFYDMKDNMEGTAYSKFRQSLRSLSDADFKRIDTSKLIDVQMRAYEDERKRRRL